MIGKLIIKLADWYDKLCRKRMEQDSQKFINWQDALNKISVR